MGESEITRLCHQIESECEAMKQGLTGYAIASKHEMIARKYDRLSAYQEQLEQLIGETQAMKITVEIYMQTVG